MNNNVNALLSNYVILNSKRVLLDLPGVVYMLFKQYRSRQIVSAPTVLTEATWRLTNPGDYAVDLKEALAGAARACAVRLHKCDQEDIGN